MKKSHISLSEKEREDIKGILCKGVTKSRTQTRLRGLLLLDAHKTMSEVSLLLEVRYATVCDWKKRYNKEGLQYLLTEKPRSGRPIEIEGSSRAKITALACSEPPEGYARWSLRLLADKIVELGYVEEISHSCVQEILKKTN